MRLEGETGDCLTERKKGRESVGALYIEYIMQGQKGGKGRCLKQGTDIASATLGRKKRKGRRDEAQRMRGAGSRGFKRGSLHQVIFSLQRLQGK